MAQAQESKVRLKFKRFFWKGGPLMPQGYSLATVAEINNNLHVFKKWGLPVKRISGHYEKSSGDIRLLDGWVSADLSNVHHTQNYNCIWSAVVKKKVWDDSKKRWENCPDFYSSDGNSLRKKLYDRIPTSAEVKEVVWHHAYCYEDVELLYWLSQKSSHTIQPDFFEDQIGPENNFMAIDHGIPLREMVRRLGPGQRGLPLPKADAEEEAKKIIRNAVNRSKKGAARSDLYGPTWAVATVELAIEIYGEEFKDAAYRNAFENEESDPIAIKGVPITTKLLSLFPGRLQNQNANLQNPEVLIEAVKRGYSKLVEKITNLSGTITQITGDDYVRVLKEAVGGGHEALVRQLLKRTDAVKLPDEEKMTLFHYGLPHKRVFDLLKKQYNRSYDEIITRQDKSGRNVLHWAVNWAVKGRYDLEVVDFLPGRLSSRAKLIRSKDHQSRTPWHIAASKGDIGMIKRLGDQLTILYPETKSGNLQEKINCIQATDSSGQTALQMAASEGYHDLVTTLLKQGSCALKERDGKRKTALHHAAEVKNPKAALATCEALVEQYRATPSKLSLLLWASATGIGTADEMEDVHKCVKDYLQKEKREDEQHLLKAAAINDNVEMTWEVLSRGADILEIRDSHWIKSLKSTEKDSVEKVLTHMDHLNKQGRDKPSMEDKLGRYVFSQGLAALLLNRCIESPITVGISGEWGMGKSSVMLQTEKILLITAAQLTFPKLLLPEQFVGAKNISPNTIGTEIYQRVNRGVHNLLGLPKNESKKQNPLVTLLEKYDHKYYHVYKALACMDNSQMVSVDSQPICKTGSIIIHKLNLDWLCSLSFFKLQPKKKKNQEQKHALRAVPRILTIQYNAWHYRNENEAWAGIGVTVSKEIEKAMTKAQWVSTCWRYTWAKQQANIWVQLLLPFLISIFLSGWFTWIVLTLLKQDKYKGLKFGSIPFTVIIIVWGLLNQAMSVVKPVSIQMWNYITTPNHTSHLGYQEEVIADINFLKSELGKQPHWFFNFILWLWSWISLGFYADNVEFTSIPKFMPASEEDIRIVIFVDDLDRCDQKIIVQVLSAITLVLARCKINVILGMDKKMIEKAIKEIYKDEDDDVAEKFICKIIQIPLSLPDPTDEEANSFLEYHLGHKIPAKDIEKKSISRIQRGIVVPIEPLEEINVNNVTEPENEAPDKQTCPCFELKGRCREINVDVREPENEAPVKQTCSTEIIKRAVEWLKKLSNELRHPYDDNLTLPRSAEGVSLIREMLLPNYTGEEARLFYELRPFTTGTQKLPREWKRLLNYHKFAWYVLFLIGNVHSLPTWKEELVVWVFVCWQWKHEMNRLVKDWNTIIQQDDGINRRRSHWPSLSKLVDKCMSQVTSSESTVNGQGNSQYNGPTLERVTSSESTLNGQGNSQYNWPTLKKALEKQDVSMEGILLFQQFRLYCEVDNLPSPDE